MIKLLNDTYSNIETLKFELSSATLKIGNYEARAEAAGFRTTVTPAMLRSGETTAVNFKLEVGACASKLRA